ncbi:MAG TPA: Asp-tRNA(Asn)/Glu-tRNA(Gln) amidotransferase subunit GatC [Caulobacteraceae bacterium]|jgi:aspartyl-tRNA(Asn)/glutamyl-tRNA(Gln) amidotransferase subunit C
MSIDVDTVRKVAALANIREPEERLTGLAEELSKIMLWIEQLTEVNTDDVAPMASAVAVALPMRADVVTDGGMREAVLANAPARRDGFFMAPKVIE